jgi:hypothetical protein
MNFVPTCSQKASAAMKNLPSAIYWIAGCAPRPMGTQNKVIEFSENGPKVPKT